MVVRVSPPMDHDLYWKRSGALVAECRGGVTRFHPDTPEWVKRTTPDQLGDLVRVWPVSVRRPSRQEVRSGLAPLESVIRSVETALVMYERTPAGKREAERRALRELLEWRPPEP
jgi:hypothetical protein